MSDAEGKRRSLHNGQRSQALDGADRYYRFSIDPDENFNRIEITLSHLFRKPSELLGGQSYGSALHSYMACHDLLRDVIAEIGGGTRRFDALLS